jgi:ferredoxin-NADP reductase
VPARVLAVIEESESIRTFRLARPPGFDFAAGQFLMVRVQEPGGGGTLARCYSISSSPDTRGYLEISVRRQGVASRALHEGIRPGDTLAIHPPLGRFTVPPDSTGDLVLVAGGIGITPLMSMLRHAVAAEPSRRVTLLYSVRAKADAAFRDELDSVARRHPQARVAITITGDGDPQGCRHGRIDAALIHEAVPDPTRSIFLICGPLAMIDGVRAVLGQMGVAQERVRFEAFEAAQALASGAGGPEEAEGAPGRLRLSKSGRDIAIRPAETLLEASERAGAPIASFCRAGICGTCRTRVLSGSVRCSAEALSEEDRERGYVLPCVAWVTGDCVLEA